MKEYIKRFWLVSLLVIWTGWVMADNYYWGQVTSQGKGVPKVVVTDGIDCVLTDAEGRYQIQKNRGVQYLYLSLPAGYLVADEQSVPLYFKRVVSSTECYDFELIKNPKTDYKHVFVVQADVQVTSEENVQRYAEFLKDMKSYLSSYRKECDVFGIDCGDIVGDKPSLYPSYLKASSMVGIPYFRVIGNHDMTHGGRTFEYSYRTFQENFGPAYYSFNKSKAHYVVLNNNFYVNRDYQYIGYIPECMFAWLEQDLKYVPQDHVIFVALHIPTSLTKKLPWNTLNQNETSNAQGLYDILKGRKAHILSGHTHFNLNVCFNEDLMEHNTASVCGIWWNADICTDGTPAGYGVYEVDGNQVKWHYKSVGYPKDFQFRAYAIGQCAEHPIDIVANVWNWDELWKVEWYEDGKRMGEMTQFKGFDPEAKMVCADKERVKYDWVAPSKTEHLFRATPKNAQAKIEVRVTDRFGKVYSQCVK